MDPLTTLLAAAAATGNTLQSQALTALRSAGPQESFFTRVGNPHECSNWRSQPPRSSTRSSPSQHRRRPPFRSSFPCQSCHWHLHGRPSTHRASHPNVAGHPQDAATGQPSTCYDANDAADSDHTTTGNAAKRPSGAHPGQFSFTHPRQLAVLAQLRCRTSKHCAAARTTSCSPVFRQWQGDLRRARDWATHSPPAPPHALWRQTRHTAPTSIRATRSMEGRDRRAVCPPRIAAEAVHGHSTDATADPGATAKTDDPAATERAELTGTDPGPLGPDPQPQP